MKTYVYLWQYLAECFLEWEIFQTKVSEEIKIHILWSTTCFRKSCRLWDNMEKYFKAGKTTDNDIIRRMRFPCWITKATDTLREYNTYCFSTATMVTRTRLTVTLYVHRMSCYLQPQVQTSWFWYSDVARKRAFPFALKARSKQTTFRLVFLWSSKAARTRWSFWYTRRSRL
jgi:hypothetical protein